jgi:hypothetical protein
VDGHGIGLDAVDTRPRPNQGQVAAPLRTIVTVQLWLDPVPPQSSTSCCLLAVHWPTHPVRGVVPNISDAPEKLPSVPKVTAPLTAETMPEVAEVSW